MQVRVGACTLKWAQAVCSPDQTAKSAWQPHNRINNQWKHEYCLICLLVIFSRR